MDLAGFGGFSKFVRFEGRSSFFLRNPEWMPSWVPFRDTSTWVLGARFGWAVPFNKVSDFDLNVPSIETNPASEVRSLDDIDEELKLPLTERYFLGGLGAFQLRGFKARSVGPRRAILKRSGFIGFGDLFTPVGRTILGAAENIGSICTDNELSFINEQGDGDGKCNSLDDQDIDDFDDLDETDVIGGNKFFSASAEYRFPISEALGLVGILFFDFGNAFDETQSIFDVAEWRYGTGFGALWFSPFGPLQAFVGFPIDKLEVEDATVFEFSVGGANF
jgi:outer membrane protein assembly factor BamA